MLTPALPAMAPTWRQRREQHGGRDHAGWWLVSDRLADPMPRGFGVGRDEAKVSRQHERESRTMRKIVVSEFVSLDGVMEDPGGAEGFKHGGWTFQINRGEEGDRFKLEETLRASAMLLGRVTYEGFAAAWPGREGEFADKFNTAP